MYGLPFHNRFGVIVRRLRLRTALSVALFALTAVTVEGQEVTRPLGSSSGTVFEIVNLYGRVNVSAPQPGPNSSAPRLRAVPGPRQSLSASEISVSTSGSKTKIEVVPSAQNKRVDLDLIVPQRSFVSVSTDAGEVHVAGNVSSVVAKTETGTISVEVPDDSVRYEMEWDQSRPRYLSDFELAPEEERRAGRFVIRGTHSKGAEAVAGNEISLRFSTGRGIVLVNVPTGQIPSNLDGRPLTGAAKAIVRSGDSMLTDAIRRASPKYFGQYAATLPPARKSPTLGRTAPGSGASDSDLRKMLVQVVDTNNRAVYDLRPDEFEVMEAGVEREIVSVESTAAPFNLVLLLDVSGSVENYQDFIRRTARAFVETADPRDRISIIIFNDDVKVLSGFTSDRAVLNESLDSFDAGGGTAYYDALAFVLADQLRPLRGERSAVVVLSDGDDNQSFLPFDSLLGSMQESGSLIYPLYVPSGLIAGSRLGEVNASIDPLRRKIMSLTSKAETEGAKLAEISGGAYYPIRKLGEIQQAYDDIVRQLRTAYTVTFRSTTADVSATRVSPKVKVRVKREGVFAKVGTAAK